MHAGREDFITVLNKNNIYSEVITFKGSPHSFILFNPWFDSTVNIVDAFIRRVFESGAVSALFRNDRGACPGCSGFSKNLWYYERTKEFHSIFQGEESVRLNV
jgi:hypothetical protein